MLTIKLLGAILTGDAVPPEATETEWLCVPSELEVVDGISTVWVCPPVVFVVIVWL